MHGGLLGGGGSLHDDHRRFRGRSEYHVGRKWKEARLFRIAPLDRVWVEAEVYASDLPLVSVGQSATISAPYLPGRALEARVAYLLPSLASDELLATV